MKISTERGSLFEDEDDKNGPGERKTTHEVEEIVALQDQSFEDLEDTTVFSPIQVN